MPHANPSSLYLSPFHGGLALPSTSAMHKSLQATKLATLSQSRDSIVCELASRHIAKHQHHRPAETVLTYLPITPCPPSHKPRLLWRGRLTKVKMQLGPTASAIWRCRDASGGKAVKVVQLWTTGLRRSGHFHHTLYRMARNFGGKIFWRIAENMSFGRIYFGSWAGFSHNDIHNKMANRTPWEFNRAVS